MSYKEEIGNNESYILYARFEVRFGILCGMYYVDMARKGQPSSSGHQHLEVLEFWQMGNDPIGHGYVLSCQQRMMPPCGSVWSKTSTSRAPSRRVKRPSNLLVGG